jgi:predicted nucleic acid-binding protein
MKIAVTDACIFIDIYDLQLIERFFDLELEIHTSFDVYNELYEEQKTAFQKFKEIGKLTLHSMNEEDRAAIKQHNFPKSLSDNDKTVLHLAQKIAAIVLSSDKAVRKQAKHLCIEYHGMLWIFDKLLEATLITHAEASKKLQELINSNVIYQNSAELISEMNRRLKLWSKHL